MLDLFCGAGGAAWGYHQALEELGINHEIVGVDIAPQKRYPFTFVQADALLYLAQHGGEYDFIHASPPCQRYSKARPLAKRDYPELIVPVREALIKTGKAYCIENVPGAPLINPTLLCGTMFGLELYRHRLFETSHEIDFRWDYGHGRTQDKLYGKQRKQDIVMVCGNEQYKGYRERAQKAMGIDWMTADELSEAIPPAYTEYIGRQMFQNIKRTTR